MKFEKQPNSIDPFREEIDENRDAPTNEISQAITKQIENIDRITFSDDVQDENERIVRGFMKGDEQYYEIYDQYLGGAGHPLDYISQERFSHFLQEIISDREIPYERKIEFFSDLTVCDDDKTIDLTALYLARLAMESTDYFSTALAVEALIKIEGTSDGFRAELQDYGMAIDLNQVISTLAKNTDNYILQIRLEKFKNSLDRSLDGDTRDQTYENEDVFTVTNGVQGQFIAESLHIIEDGQTRPLSIQDIESRDIDERDAQEFLFDYQYLMRGFVREQIGDDLGIDLTLLSMHEQVWFLQYLKEVKIEDIDEKRSFLNTYGLPGARSFLSLRNGGVDMGEKILAIGKKYDHEMSSQIFHQYGDLVDVVDTVGDYVHEQVKEADDDFVNRIREHLLIRGQKFLEMLADTDADISIEHIQKILTNFTASAEVFKGTVKELVAQGRTVDVLDLGDAIPVSLSGDSLTEARRTELYDNYVASITSYPKEMQKKLLENYSEALGSGDVEFFMYTHQDRIASSAGFRKREDGSVHFFGFNTHEKYTQSGIASVIMEIAVRERSKDHIIHAECDPFSGIGQNYINRQGFVATEFFQYEGKPSFRIALDQSVQYPDHDTEVHSGVVCDLASFTEGDSPLTMTFSSDQMSLLQEKVFGRGYVLTHIVPTDHGYEGIFCKKSTH